MRIPQLDRRVLYMLLALVVSIPLLVNVPLPPPAITPPTKSFYETIETVSADPKTKDKLVIISCNFGSGTLAENLSQLEATLNLIVSKRMKFAIFAFNDPQGRDLGGRGGRELERGVELLVAGMHFHGGKMGPAGPLFKLPGPRPCCACRAGEPPPGTIRPPGR